MLARQQLLERADAPVPAVLARVGGLQAQYAPSMYVGLWSRAKGFARDDLDAALAARTVVQATLMRVTIHLVAREDFWPFALATRDARRRLWLRSRRGGPGEPEMEAAARELRARLAAGGPATRKELDALVGKARAEGVGLWHDMVRVPPSGTWARRRADLYGDAEDWIGPPQTSPEAGVEHLVRRYLAGFGPASKADVAAYTGLPQSALTPALARVEPVRLRAEDGTELLDLPGAPLPAGDTPAPVRFLPTWDATLLVHARRAGILPERHRPRIFHVRNPRSEATFLVDGAVAGTWRHDGERIVLEPFEPIDAAAHRELGEEAGRLEALFA